MKLIHIIHGFKKLFTLKRSCFLASSTLKHSWSYAETLLLTIYTCIYLYIKTCSWGQQIVNNFLSTKIKSFFSMAMIILLSGLVTACHQIIHIPLDGQQQLNVNQRLGTQTQPAQFYLCGSHRYPCKSVTYKWQAIKPAEATRHITEFNNAKETKHETRTKGECCTVKAE